MSNGEELYEALLDAGFTNSEIESEITKISHLYGGFLSTGAILFVIAKEKGLKIKKSDEGFEEEGTMGVEIDYEDFQINISSISEGNKNMVIAGRIAENYGIKEFQRKDGTKGTVGSFTIRDSTGKVKVVLWDGQVQVMTNEFFKFNELVRIIGGYPKIGHNGIIEVHLNRKGLIQIAPDGLKINKYPKLSIKESPESRRPLKSIKIAELLKREGFYEHISGRVKIEEFVERDLKNGEKSFLLRFMLCDGNNCIEAVVWGMKAVEYFKILVDAKEISLSNVLVKENHYTHSKQVRITKRSILEKKP